jgi:hypothetical protein
LQLSWVFLFKVEITGKRNPKKPRGRVWPGLTSVGGDIQPQVVTVLTPATQRRWQDFSRNLKFVNAKKLAK